MEQSMDRKWLVGKVLFYRSESNPANEQLRELGIKVSEEPTKEEIWLNYGVDVDEITEFRDYDLRENCSLLYLVSGRELVLNWPFQQVLSFVSANRKSTSPYHYTVQSPQA